MKRLTTLFLALFLIAKADFAPATTVPYTGLISGTPTTAGDFRFQVEVTSAVSSDDEIFELVVAYDATLSVVKNIGDVSALIKASDGNLYGVNSDGGKSSDGSVFKLTPDGVQTVIYGFAFPGPSSPNDLDQAADGSFYGTATQGGANYAGIIFKIAADGTMTTLASFPELPPDSAETPTVLLANDGNYYCSLRPFILGLKNPGGFIYKVTPDGTLTTLHAFNGSDGFYPSALIQGG